MTSFFIGENYKEKIDFGIFYDEVSGNYVVYKNKDDGSRAIRYEGKDQTYAVNELYLKLKEEIQNKKIIILEKIITIKKYNCCIYNYSYSKCNNSNIIIYTW